MQKMKQSTSTPLSKEERLKQLVEEAKERERLFKEKQKEKKLQDNQHVEVPVKSKDAQISKKKRKLSQASPEKPEAEEKERQVVQKERKKPRWSEERKSARDETTPSKQTEPQNGEVKKNNKRWKPRWSEETKSIRDGAVPNESTPGRKSVSFADNLVEERSISPLNASTEQQESSLSNSTDSEPQSSSFPVLGIKPSTKHKTPVPPVTADWVKEPEAIEADIESCRKSLGDAASYLDDSLIRCLRDNGISHLFPVQHTVIPFVLEHRRKAKMHPPQDICVSAPTGSGKTLAFVLPIIQTLKSRTVRDVRAVILLPVRELAKQVFDVFEQYSKDTDLKIALLSGAKPLENEALSLVRKTPRGFCSQVDVIVATPGRLLSHIRLTDGFSLQRLEFLVLDEADRMLEDIQCGLIEEIETAVCQDRPNVCRCQTSNLERCSLHPLTFCSLYRPRIFLQKLLYSATFTHDPEKLETMRLFNPKLFSVKSDGVEESEEDGVPIQKFKLPQTLSQGYVVSKLDIKPLIVWQIVKNNFKRVLCFTKSKDETHRLCLLLKTLKGVKVEEFSSELKPTERNKLVSKFSSGDVQMLVCTNVLARGLDFDDVDLVLSYDLPQSVKAYVHRVGRTARAGKPGMAITMLCPHEVKRFTEMLSAGVESSSAAEDLSEKYNTGIKKHHKAYENALMKAGEVIAAEKKKQAISNKMHLSKKQNKQNNSR